MCSSAFIKLKWVFLCFEFALMLLDIEGNIANLLKRKVWTH